MANNRLYIVDKSTGDYLCLAKGDGLKWSPGNIELYKAFMNTRIDPEDKTNLIIGTENDQGFYEKYLKKGLNFNKNNEWK